MSNNHSSSPQAIMSHHLIGLINPIVRSAVASPLNRIRILIQTGTSSSSLSNQDVTNNDHSLLVRYGKKIIKEEGTIGLWKGFTCQLTTSLIIQYTTTPITQFTLSFSSSPALAFLINSLITYPLEQCKTILAASTHVNDINNNDTTSSQSRVETKSGGMIDYFKRRTIENGLLSHYNGFLLYILGNYTYRALLFFLYDSTMSTLSSLPNDTLPVWSIVPIRILISQLCIGVASGIVYPLDTVCRRLQLHALENKHTNMSPLQCVKKIVREEGVLALWGGFGIHCLSAFTLTMTLLVLNRFEL